MAGLIVGDIGETSKNSPSIYVYRPPLRPLQVNKGAVVYIYTLYARAVGAERLGGYLDDGLWTLLRQIGSSDRFREAHNERKSDQSLESLIRSFDWMETCGAA